MKPTLKSAKAVSKEINEQLENEALPNFLNLQKLHQHKQYKYYSHLHCGSAQCH